MEALSVSTSPLNPSCCSIPFGGAGHTKRQYASHGSEVRSLTAWQVSKKGSNLCQRMGIRAPWRRGYQGVPCKSTLRVSDSFDPEEQDY